jgi:NADH-quinone oxidoreductase subunit A
MGQYLPILALLILAVLFAALSFVASAKVAPYECGILPSREPPERFPVSFYLVAMLFIMFDIEIIFLYPYVVAHEELGGYGFAEVISFSVVFFLTFVYVVARGALDWGPVNRARRLDDPSISAARTSSTTVRRVGSEGRFLDDSESAA